MKIKRLIKNKKIKRVLGTIIFSVVILIFSTREQIKVEDVTTRKSDEQAGFKKNENLHEQSQDQEMNNETPEEDIEELDSQNLPDTEFFLVKRVIDGDTIELENGKKVRYIGIDTPETVHPNKAAQCYGKESSDKNKSIVEGKKVRLEKDITETDKYKRLLRYVYLEDGTFVNLLLVKEGYARSYTYPPDVKYQDEILDAEKEARKDGGGRWAKNACN